MSPLGTRNYFVLFGFLGLICLVGLFVPLMDNDAAHHANIALHMYLTGDYVNLVDNGKDYLDKPHLHFWLAALSYQLFGVNGVAYKLPSFLISIGGVFSLYKLGVVLFNREAGRLSALILATSFAFFISLSDVRMDAILVSAICFSCWQIIEIINRKQWFYILGASLGLAVGFSVKGSVGLLVPTLFTGWYLLEKKQGRFLWSPRFILMGVLSILFISPVLYCYYLQFDLHPEKSVRAINHISGIKFALIGGATERFSGGMSNDAGKDWFFFFHTFLWAFAPWSVLAYMSIVKTLREKKNWFLSATVLSLALLIGFAGSKLPHYLNISFPFAALLVAWMLNEKPIKGAIAIILYSMTGILLASNFLVNGWLFPEKIYRLFLFFAVFMFGSIFSSKTPVDTKPFAYLIRAALYLYLFLNMNFYFQLLNYQGGQTLAEKIKGTIPSQNVFFWKDNYSSSFCFATKTLRRELTDSTKINTLQTANYLVYDSFYEKEIADHGWVLGEKISVLDFEITKIDKEFANPETREARCSKLIIARLLFFRQK